jgi:hypothetical protein
MRDPFEQTLVTGSLSLGGLGFVTVGPLILHLERRSVVVSS